MIPFGTFVLASILGGFVAFVLGFIAGRSTAPDKPAPVSQHDVEKNTRKWCAIQHEKDDLERDIRDLVGFLESVKSQAEKVIAIYGDDEDDDDDEE